MVVSRLKEIAAQDDEPVTVVIYQKNGEPYLASDGSEATMSVVGSESKRLRAAKTASTRRMLHSKRQKVTPEDLEQSRRDYAVAGVVDWHGWEDNGNPWPCTPENVRTLLVLEHILEQVEAAITGHADFFGKSSET